MTTVLSNPVRLMQLFSRRQYMQCGCGVMATLKHQRTSKILFRCSTQQTDVGLDAPKDAVSYQVGSIIGKIKYSLAKYTSVGLTSKKLYECCAEGIYHEEFFKACDMPDTFQSWFYVMQLHIWMILVRLRVEGKHGKNISYKMVELMWKDVEQRMKLIGVEDTSERRETLQEYAQQFFGLIIAYDEGILGHDRVLASALWRNLFYNKHNTDAESLAHMVGYVRRQMQYLDGQNSDTIMLEGEIKWLPLDHEAPMSTKQEIPDPG